MRPRLQHTAAGLADAAHSPGGIAALVAAARSGLVPQFSGAAAAPVPASGARVEVTAVRAASRPGSRGVSRGRDASTAEQGGGAFGGSGGLGESVSHAGGPLEGSLDDASARGLGAIELAPLPDLVDVCCTLTAASTMATVLTRNVCLAGVYCRLSLAQDGGDVLAMALDTESGTRYGLRLPADEVKARVGHAAGAPFTRAAWELVMAGLALVPVHDGVAGTAAAAAASLSSGVLDHERLALALVREESPLRAFELTALGRRWEGGVTLLERACALRLSITDGAGGTLEAVVPLARGVAGASHAAAQWAPVADLTAARAAVVVDAAEPLGAGGGAAAAAPPHAGGAPPPQPPPPALRGVRLVVLPDAEPLCTRSRGVDGRFLRLTFFFLDRGGPGSPGDAVFVQGFEQDTGTRAQLALSWPTVVARVGPLAWPPTEVAIAALLPALSFIAPDGLAGGGGGYLILRSIVQPPPAPGGNTVAVSRLFM